MAQMVKYMVCTIHRWHRWSNRSSHFTIFFSFLGKMFFPHTQMAQMAKYMVCTIHGWLRWSNIWFASYTDGYKKIHFSCNDASLFTPGPGPGARWRNKMIYNFFSFLGKKFFYLKGFLTKFRDSVPKF